LAGVVSLQTGRGRGQSFFTLAGDSASQLLGSHILLGEKIMASALYAVGYLLTVGVVSYLAYLSHIPESYIFAIVVIMIGIGVVSGLETARQKDSNY
jgi:hypothetical protein